MFDKIKSIFKDIKYTKKSKEEEILAKPNVCGVGVKDNQIIVLVEKKLPLDYLRPVDVVPSSLDGFETKVIEVGEITASTVSGCPKSGTACSIAGICKKGNDTYYLSNSHCKFNSVGEDYLSPSPLDGGTRKDKVGVVSEQSEVSGSGDYKVDALIAKTTSSKDVTLETETARLNDMVDFEGRTSGKQTLRVVADDVTINVNYGLFTGKMVNQIMLEGIVRGGDSGSGLMKNGKICGLIFASNNVNYAFANKIQNVMSEMGIEFKTSTGDIWSKLPNFKRSEFKYPDNIKESALLKLQAVRTDWKKSIITTSDWRPVGSHSSGCEFDLKSTGGVFYQWLNKSYEAGLGNMFYRILPDLTEFEKDEQYKFAILAISHGFNRVGIYNRHIHIGFDPNSPQLVVWAGVSE